MKTWLTAAILILIISAHVVAQERFITKLKLPTGQMVVVAEGDFEARSIGSFSIRLYEATSVSDETIFFSNGLIRPRDGIIEKAVLADVERDQQPEVIVIIRSVGTGSYLSAYAFAFAKDELLFCGVVKELAPRAYPVVSMRKSKQKHK